MLDEVKESIINAYEIKTNLSRAKLAHLMDAETWMDANSAVEMGFADEIMKRGTQDDVPAASVSMTFSRAAVTNSLMDKISAHCRMPAKPEIPEATERKVEQLYERLDLMKNHF